MDFDPEFPLNLTDPTLFGNDAAEDEQEDVFSSYAFERDEVAIFSDVNRSLCVALAYKGEGKSALLRLSERKIRATEHTTNVDKIVLIHKTASELSPEVANDDHATWIRAWKAAILGMFATEIGSKIGVAWSDDAMSLVEEAEKTGFKQRNFVSAVLSRLGVRVDAGGIGVELSKKDVGSQGIAEATKRWVSAEGKLLWLFVDDVDKNFQNISSHRNRVSSFFDACRELVKAIPEFHVRTTIRPNVWSILRLEFESLSHVEQYIVRLTWTEAQARTLLRRRIEGYLKRKNRWDVVNSRLRQQDEERDKEIIALAFEGSMQWGQGSRPPHVILYTLSKHRPRWMIELSKVAAASATSREHRRVTLNDITTELGKFGTRRIEDTVAEFRTLCPQIEELILAFTREEEQFSTDRLLRVIDNKILTHLSPTISGVSGRPNNLHVAALLYEIGLIYARRDRQDGTYVHFSYAERPGLLRSRTSIDAGLSWEVHPVYRQALEMRDAGGSERGRSNPRKAFR